MTEKRAVKTVSVFGSGRAEPDSADYEAAWELGRALARAGFAVCTGGYGGVMEAVSRGAKEAGGHTIGVTAEVFAARANPWVVEEIRVKTWHERLLELIRRGDAYVVLPGGTGTLTELAVVWEWLHKGFLVAKPLVVLGDFWEPVVATVTAKENVGHLVTRAATPGQVVALLQGWLKD